MHSKQIKNGKTETQKIKDEKIKTQEIKDVKTEKIKGKYVQKNKVTRTLLKTGKYFALAIVLSVPIILFSVTILAFSLTMLTKGKIKKLYKTLISKIATSLKKKTNQDEEKKIQPKNEPQSKILTELFESFTQKISRLDFDHLFSTPKTALNINNILKNITKFTLVYKSKQQINEGTLTNPEDEKLRKLEKLLKNINKNLEKLKNRTQLKNDIIYGVTNLENHEILEKTFDNYASDISKLIQNILLKLDATILEFEHNQLDDSLEDFSINEELYNKYMQALDQAAKALFNNAQKLTTILTIHDENSICVNRLISSITLDFPKIFSENQSIVSLETSKSLAAIYDKFLKSTESDEIKTNIKSTQNALFYAYNCIDQIKTSIKNIYDGQSKKQHSSKPKSLNEYKTDLKEALLKLSQLKNNDELSSLKHNGELSLSPDSKIIAGKNKDLTDQKIYISKLEKTKENKQV